VSGRVINNDGSVRYIQVEQASLRQLRGAVIDSSGTLRGVVVAASTNGGMGFIIPGEYAGDLLQGKSLEVVPGIAYYEGSATPVAKQPVAVKFGDPLRRIAKVNSNTGPATSAISANRRPRSPRPRRRHGASIGRADLHSEKQEASGNWCCPTAVGAGLLVPATLRNGDGTERWGPATPFAQAARRFTARPSTWPSNTRPAPNGGSTSPAP